MLNRRKRSNVHRSLCVVCALCALCAVCAVCAVCVRMRVCEDATC